MVLKRLAKKRLIRLSTMRVAPATETILNQVLKKREGGIPQIIERNLYKFLNVKKAEKVKTEFEEIKPPSWKTIKKR